MKQATDLILYGGTIYLVDEAFSTCEAVAIRDGVILALGTNAEILSQYEAPQTIDLQGQFAYPGLIDPHGHIHRYAQSLAEVNLRDCRSAEEMFARVKEAGEKQPEGWLVGRGWDQNLWLDPRFPTNEWLNHHFPDRPVLLERVDIHASLVNEVVLQRAGFDTQTCLAGGQLLQQQGRLTGLLVDAAHQVASELIEQPREAQWEELLLQAQEELLAVGLTGVGDALLTHTEAERLKRLAIKDKWVLPVYGMLPADDFHLKTYLPQGPQTHGPITLAAFKLFADGTFGSRSAWLKAPYADASEAYGLSMLDTAHTKIIAQQIAEAGFQLNIHAIGDAAIAQVLDIFADTMPAGNPLRWRIEHAQLLDQGLWEEMRRLNVLPSPQPLQATSDKDWLEVRLGPERMPWAHMLKGLLSITGQLPLSTDFPIEVIDPLHTLFAAITRKPWVPESSVPIQPKQALSPAQALGGITQWAAYAQHQETDRGSLCVGSRADFVISNHDLLTIHEKNRFLTKIVATILGGRIVYSTWFS